MKLLCKLFNKKQDNDIDENKPSIKSKIRDKYYIRKDTFGDGNEIFTIFRRHMCKLFGHKWSERRYIEGPFVNGCKALPYKRCLRCNEFAWDFNRSDLDESENVFGEE